jgi:plasmid stability protein
MAQLVVRNLDESIKLALKERAALRGTSMESEARAILERALRRGAPGRGLGTTIRSRFAEADAGVELERLAGDAVTAPDLPG